MVEKTFLKNIKRYNLLKKKDKVILGVSGGPDSVALLYNFIGVKEAYKLKIVCAHFDHGLRPESGAEKNFIEKLCKKMKVEFISEKKNVGNFSRDSLEQTARNLRFDFFLKCSRQLKMKKIALAHHKNDLAETVLMRIIRGTGLRGLRGILPKNKFKSLTIIRPFINLKKDDLLAWLDEKNISFCLDSSNQDLKFLRNKIRVGLLPQLQEINPNLVNRLADLGESAGLDYDFIYKFSQQEFNRLKKKNPGKSLCLNLEGLRKLHPAIFANVIRISVEVVKGNTRRFEQSHLNQVKTLIEKGRDQSSLNLPGLVVKKEKEALSIQSLIL